MAADTWGQPGDPFSGADFLKGVAKYGFGTNLGDRGSNTRDAKNATRMSAFEKAYLRQQQNKASGSSASGGGFQDLGGGNTVWRQPQQGRFTTPGRPGKGGFGSVIGAGLGAVAGTVLAPGLGTAMGARIGGSIGGGVDSYLYS